ncbi:plasminogen activator inhibitor 2 [Tachyglossus aculeatus]|uniref:plasminogen activator inhibitor 2 n=1 Tax=Tachyglossus aculeatus TaxID=9261 RepID=UPI0018F43D03|nr:plasminogen activator inhibitor 2 [Tachyglossus aculeatus]
MEDLQAANTSFVLDLFKALSKANKNKNIFFSPWSISSAMAMVYLGARGNTAAQMSEVLHFNQVGGDEVDKATQVAIKKPIYCEMMQQIRKEDYPPAIQKAQARNEIHTGFQALGSAVNKASEVYVFESANKLFGDKSFQFKEEYLHLCEEYYSAEPQAVNFMENANETRKQINSWVEIQTKGKIPVLLPEGSVDEETKLILVNAVYFKGKWENPFQKKATKQQPFRVSLSQHKPVQMMHQKATLQIGYIEELKTQILELPYKGDISMFLLLPDEISDSSTGLDQLEKELTYEKLNEWTSKSTMKKGLVYVYLPQFKLEENCELKSILSSMGMKDAFIPGKANFSGMSENNNLFLSQVFHKASVEVNEEGTEAAAGSGAVMSGRTGYVELQFVADHPFLFFIKHNKTNGILFYGRFCSP